MAASHPKCRRVCAADSLLPLSRHPPWKSGPRRGHDGRFCVEQPLEPLSLNDTRDSSTYTNTPRRLDSRADGSQSRFSVTRPHTWGPRVGRGPRIRCPRKGGYKVRWGGGLPVNFLGCRVGCWRCAGGKGCQSGYRLQRSITRAKTDKEQASLKWRGWKIVRRNNTSGVGRMRRAHAPAAGRGRR